MQTVVRAEYVPAEVCVATYLVTCGIRATATNRNPANYSGVVFKNLFGQWCQQAGSSANSGRCTTLRQWAQQALRPCCTCWCNVLSRAPRNIQNQTAGSGTVPRSRGFLLVLQPLYLNTCVRNW